MTKKYMAFQDPHDGLISFTITMVIALVIWAIIFRPDWNLTLDFILPGR